MIFLIQYDRQGGKVIKLEEYKNSEQEKAEDKRLALELRLNRKNVHHEVVLLQATSRNLLNRTHSRYFKSADEIKEGIE